MPAGRPTKYKPEYVEQVQRLCEIGATDFEIAQFLKVDVATIYRWKAEHKDFCEAVIAGKELADERVVRSMYQRAVGYTFETEKLFHNSGEIIRANTIEHVPPDSGAALNWLKNRRRNEWRDKIDHEHTGKDGTPLVPVLNVTVTPSKS